MKNYKLNNCSNWDDIKKMELKQNAYSLQAKNEGRDLILQTRSRLIREHQINIKSSSDMYVYCINNDNILL